MGYGDLPMSPPGALTCGPMEDPGGWAPDRVGRGEPCRWRTAGINAAKGTIEGTMCGGEACPLEGACAVWKATAPGNVGAD